MQIIGILNAYEPTIIVRSQEPSIRLSCVQLWRHCCASNVKNVGRQTFQETSVHIIFIESCNIHLLKNSLHSSPCKNLLICCPRTEVPCSKDLSLHGAMLNAMAHFLHRKECRKPSEVLKDTISKFRSYYVPSKS